MSGSSNLPRVSHDAYKRYEAEAALVDGKISLPDLGFEYETADGERAYIDLELATELPASPHEPKAARRIQDLQRELDLARLPRRVERGGS